MFGDSLFGDIKFSSTGLPSVIPDWICIKKEDPNYTEKNKANSIWLEKLKEDSNWIEKQRLIYGTKVC